MTFLVTERENNMIKRYAKLHFQTKSEFIRSSIRQKIDEFNKLTLLHKDDPRFKEDKSRKEIMAEYKKEELIKDISSVIPPKKPNINEIELRKEEIEKRKHELRKELKRIEIMLKE